MKFWTRAAPVAKLGIVALLIVGLIAVHAAFLLYSPYRSETLLVGADAATSVVVTEAHETAGGDSFGCSVRHRSVSFWPASWLRRFVGSRSARSASPVGRGRCWKMLEGDVEPSPVDSANRDELVEVEHALNEMATRIAVQSRRQAAQHAATRVLLADSETPGRTIPAILKAICESLGWYWSALWTIDREKGVLRCGEIWHAPTVQLVGRLLRHEPGHDLRP